MVTNEQFSHLNSSVEFVGFKNLEGFEARCSMLKGMKYLEGRPRQWKEAAQITWMTVIIS